MLLPRRFRHRGRNYPLHGQQNLNVNPPDPIPKPEEFTVEKIVKKEPLTILPGQKPTPKELHFIQILKLILDYLNLEDFALGIQFLNRNFNHIFSLEPGLLVFLANKYYLSQPNPHPNIRRYFKIQFKKFHPQTDVSVYQDQLSQLENRLIMTRNGIRNPYGNKGFDGWSITHNGGNKWVIDHKFAQKNRRYCFATSYEWDEMKYEVKFSELPTIAQTSFLEGKAVIKVGCYIAKRWDCPAEAYVEAQIFGADKAKLFHKRVDKRDSDIPRGTTKSSPYLPIVIEYEVQKVENKVIVPDIILLQIGGRDRKFWVGHYGAKFSGAFIRCDMKIQKAEKHIGSSS